MSSCCAGRECKLDAHALVRTSLVVLLKTLFGIVVIQKTVFVLEEVRRESCTAELEKIFHPLRMYINSKWMKDFLSSTSINFREENYCVTLREPKFPPLINKPVLADPTFFK